MLTSRVQDEVKNLKHLLEGWRRTLITLKSVILWEQQWHPAVIFGTVTFHYFLVWIFNLSSLASFAVVCILLSFIDFMINLVYGASAWTYEHEKAFINICIDIVVNYHKIFHEIRLFYLLRETMPNLYYTLNFSMLCTLMFIALSIKNTLAVLYILTSAMLLWPGIAHTKVFHSLFNNAKKE